MPAMNADISIGPFIKGLKGILLKEFNGRFKKICSITVFPERTNW